MDVVRISEGCGQLAIGSDRGRHVEGHLSFDKSCGLKYMGLFTLENSNLFIC